MKTSKEIIQEMNDFVYDPKFKGASEEIKTLLIEGFTNSIARAVLFESLYSGNVKILTFK